MSFCRHQPPTPSYQPRLLRRSLYRHHLQTCHIGRHRWPRPQSPHPVPQGLLLQTAVAVAAAAAAAASCPDCLAVVASSKLRKTHRCHSVSRLCIVDNRVDDDTNCADSNMLWRTYFVLTFEWHSLSYSCCSHFPCNCK